MPGPAEFVPIGLSDVMASSLNVTVEQVGATVTAYALGATFSAPILTALTASWSRKNVMLVTALVFTPGASWLLLLPHSPQWLLHALWLASGMDYSRL